MIPDLDADTRFVERGHACREKPAEGGNGGQRWQRLPVARPLFRAAVAMAQVILDQRLPHGTVGMRLVIGAQRGVDVEAVGIGRVAVTLDHCLAHHLGDIGCIDLDRQVVK